MSSELTEKRREHADHQSANEVFSVSQESLQTLQQDIKTMIALLDEETPSPHLMNEWVKRCVLNVTVHRGTDKLSYDSAVVAGRECIVSEGNFSRLGVVDIN